MKNTSIIFGSSVNKPEARGLDAVISELNRAFEGDSIRLGMKNANPYSAESLDAPEFKMHVDSLGTSVNTSLETAMAAGFPSNAKNGSSGSSVVITHAGRQAAHAAAVLASNPRAHLTSRPNDSRGYSAEELHTGNGLHDVVDRRLLGHSMADGSSFSMEAYDTRELRDTTVYSILYNQRHGSQDEFAEAFFPTVTVSPDQAGYTISMNVMTIMGEVRRNISGDETDFQRHNLIHAVIDPSIMNDNYTKLIPVYRTESAHNFVDTALLATERLDLFGETVETSYLTFKSRKDLLGISQTDRLLQTGILDSTDAIDSSVRLDKLLLKITDGTDSELIALRVAHMHESNFIPAVQGNFRELRLNFDTRSVLLGGTGAEIVKQANGTDSVLLKSLKDNNLALRVGMVVTGALNTETGSLTMSSNLVEVTSLSDQDGNKIAAGDPRFDAVAAVFGDAELLGFTLDGRRTNSNRRDRGDLVDTTYQSQMYQPQLRSPITIPRPETNVDNTDSTDIAALLVATGIRTTNAAIDQIHITKEVLAQHFNPTDPVKATPSLLGVALGPIRPFYESTVIDVVAEMNNLKSFERTLDVQAVLINRIRDVAYRAYRESGYKPVADALAGGISKKPTVLIGTDPVISGYLITPGDVRTLGNEMDYKIVSTFNNRVKNQIFITFMNPDSAASGIPDPLTFGNMGWKPELVIALPTYFNGANSRQITVQPCYIHVVNMPILMHFEVQNLAEAVNGKATLEVTP